MGSNKAFTSPTCLQLSVDGGAAVSWYAYIWYFSISACSSDKLSTVQETTMPVATLFIRIAGRGGTFFVPGLETQTGILGRGAGCVARDWFAKIKKN